MQDRIEADLDRTPRLSLYTADTSTNTASAQSASPLCTSERVAVGGTGVSSRAGRGWPSNTPMSQGVRFQLMPNISLAQRERATNNITGAEVQAIWPSVASAVSGPVRCAFLQPCRMCVQITRGTALGILDGMLTG